MFGNGVYQNHVNRVFCSPTILDNRNQCCLPTYIGQPQLPTTRASRSAQLTPSREQHVQGWCEQPNCEAAGGRKQWTNNSPHRRPHSVLPDFEATDKRPNTAGLAGGVRWVREKEGRVSGRCWTLASEDDSVCLCDIVTWWGRSSVRDVRHSGECMCSWKYGRYVQTNQAGRENEGRHCDDCMLLNVTVVNVASDAPVYPTIRDDYLITLITT